MLAIAIGRHNKTLSHAESEEMLEKLNQVPKLQQEFMVRSKDEIATIARTYKYASNFLYLGRGFNFPIIREGALKLTQMPYIHCEAYPAAEMKHGPIALIDEFMPVLFIAMKDAVYEKVVSNIREVQARKGAVIAVTDKDNHELDELCDFVIRMESSDSTQIALLGLIPLTMLAYELANARKCDLDHPRHQTRSFDNNFGRSDSGRLTPTSQESPTAELNKNEHQIHQTPRGDTDFSKMTPVQTIKGHFEHISSTTANEIGH